MRSNPHIRIFLRGGFILRLCVLALLALKPDASVALGTALPLSNPEQVIETLPAASHDAQLQQWRERLANNPADPDALLGTGNRYLDLAAQTGDERYLGYLTRLLQESGARQSSEITILHARLLQRQHQFDAAKAVLEPVLRANPYNAQAQLLMAYIAMAQGEPQRARSHCTAAFQQAPTIATHCAARAQALNGHARQAREKLLRLQKILVDPKEQQDVQLTLAEIEQRMGLDANAEQRFRQILQGSPQHMLAQLHLADMLLHQQRYGECWQLLRKSDQQPSLLLRKAIAARMLSLDDHKGLQARLQRYFDIESLRNANYASRDYAIYLHALVHHQADAARVAQQNWQTQREPDDAIAVLQTADASGNQDAKAAVLLWARQTGLEDIRIAKVDRGLLSGKDAP
jgi:Tfp pilus assembly protein PilF